MRGQMIAVTVLLLASAVLFTAGVVKKITQPPLSARRGKTIAVIPKGTASMWWEVVHQGALAAGKEFGYEIAWTGPEQETDREKQIQIVEDAIVKQSAAIVLGPNDAQALVRPVEKIRDAGIPCIIIDSAVDTDVYHSFAATDNFAGGVVAARRLGARLSGRGRVLLTQFVQNSASTENRAAGFKLTLAQEFPDIELVAEQYTLGTVEDARQKTVDMLTRYPDVDGVFAVNQPASVGALKALQNQQLAVDVVFVGFDSDPVLVQGIERGEVEALVVQNPFEIGYQGVCLAVDVIEGRPVPKRKPIDSMVVDADNLAEMKQRHPSALGL